MKTRRALTILASLAVCALVASGQSSLADSGVGADIFAAPSPPAAPTIFSINDDALGSPQTVTLSGTGVVLSIGGSGCRLAGGDASGLGPLAILTALAVVAVMRKRSFLFFIARPPP